MIRIETSGDYVQLIYVDPVGESVQQELKSDTDAFECSYDSDGKLFMQFGAMRFENPDPTDFIIEGDPVTDAADFISKLNALFTGGGGGGATIYTGDGTIANGVTRTITMEADAKLVIRDSLSSLLTIDHTTDAQRGQITATNNDNTRFSELTVFGNQDDNIRFILVASSTPNTSQIIGNADTNTLLYQSGSHQFDGINEFVDDAAAAAGGVPVNGLYHSMGTVKIRLS